MKDLCGIIDFKNNRIKTIVGLIIIAVQMIVSVVTLWYLHRLNIMPAKYFYTLLAVLIVLLFASGALNLYKKTHIIGKVLGVIISIFLILVCVYEHNAYRMLSAITQEHYDVDNYVLVVRNDSVLENVSQLAGKTVGVLENPSDKSAVDNAVTQLKQAVGSDDIKLVRYDVVTDLISALNNKDVDAIFYNKAVDEIVNEVIVGYSDSIKVLAEYEVKTIVEQNQGNQSETETKTENESETETESERPTEADNIRQPVYDPSRDPNAPGGGGYIGGDGHKDNSKKGPITDRAFNIYISGIDCYGKVSGKSRSDVNILMTVNPMTKEIVLTNTPRDYYVPIPGVTPGNWRDKLTHAGIYGVWTSVATIENIYDVEIDYYVRINFTSFIDIINALGSIEVYSDYTFSAGGYNFQKGKNTFTSGAQALAFARERHAFAAGDHQRGRNQMAVINGIINKSLSPAILTNFVPLVNSVSTSVQTNMTMDEITQLAKMQIDDGASWSIAQQAVTGSGGTRECYSMKNYQLSVVLPNQASIDSCKAKIQSVMKGKK